MGRDVTESNLAAVRRICEHWPWLTREEFRELMASDCDYRNIPVPNDQHIGPDAAHDVLSRLRDNWDIRLEVVNLVASPTTVLTERIEHFAHRRGEKPSFDLPVMGAFELRGGKIIAWRDYFEMSQAKLL
jgi:limonene-1,2-epoxide hydrolase